MEEQGGEPMKRGIVMSIHENHAVVMTRDGQFLKAPLQGSPQLGHELLFEEEAGTPPARRRRFGRPTLTRYIGAAAAVMLLLTAYLVYSASQANAVVAYVTMDINPSIEIGIDDKEKVRELRAVNEAGSRLIQDIAYKGHELESVATVILEKASSAHYLDAPHKDILIASIWMNGSEEQIFELESMLAQSLNGELRNWLDAHDKPADSVTITTLFLPAEMKTEADSAGISAGKMALYLMAKDEGYALELDSLKKQSIDKATESIGGVGQIVGDPQNPSTKAKLQQLLKQEQSEQQGTAGKPSAAASEKPGQQATNKPGEKPPTKPPVVKPAAKPTSKPTGKPTKGAAAKPSPTAKPDKGSHGGNANWGEREDWDDWVDEWGEKWSKAELEKLKKEWEKAGKDWREQWKKWEEEHSPTWGFGNKGSGTPGASWSWNGNDDDDRKNNDSKDLGENTSSDKNGGRDRDDDDRNDRDKSGRDKDSDDDRGQGRGDGKQNDRKGDENRGSHGRD
jgi:hypothetical protein